MLDNESIAVVIIYIFGCFVNWVASYVIKDYHESKPLGMQSLFGKTIVIFINSFVIIVVTVALLFVLSELAAPLNVKISGILAVIEYLVGITFYLSVMVVSFTKYLSIYHGPAIQDLEEDAVLGFIKRFHIMFPALLASLEFTFWTEPRQTEAYKLLSQDATAQSSRTGYGMKIMALLAFVSVMGLQARLEYDFLSQEKPDKQSGSGVLQKAKEWLTAKSENASEYKLSVTRLIVIIVAILVVVLALEAFKVITFRVCILIVFVVLSDICPIIFIVSHPSLRVHSFKIIKAPFRFLA